MKIIAFPFAGGNKHSFSNIFDNRINFKTIEYKSRGERIREPSSENIEQVVEDAYNQMCLHFKEDDSNYIIYGHSMGALVGYLICKKLEQSEFKKPIKLVVSGAKSPVYTRDKKLSTLPDKEFWNEVSKLGGIPEEVKNHPELIEYFTPILKADFKCIENYKHDNNASKLTIPIDVFYGDDEDITQAEAEAWQEETTANVNVTELKGNHFFIFEQNQFFIKYFKNLELNATI